MTNRRTKMLSVDELHNRFKALSKISKRLGRNYLKKKNIAEPLSEEEAYDLIRND